LQLLANNGIVWDADNKMIQKELGDIVGVIFPVFLVVDADGNMLVSH